MTVGAGPARARLWRRPVLRTDEDRGRHREVSWLELFVDLAFVVVVSRVAEYLARRGEEHVDPAALATFLVAFLAVFWVWNSFTYYTERFESDGVDHRVLGFAAVVPVAGMAVFGADGLDAGLVGFVLAYVLARLLNIACWVWAAVHCREFRRVAARFVAGFLVAALVIAAALAVGPPWGIVLFAAAVAIEIATPAATVRHQAALPSLSTSRFPERLGQFTIIVLGEAVLETVGALDAVRERHALGVGAVVLGLLGLGISFALCWVYFDFVARRAARGTFVAGLVWVYLHMVVLIGITVAGVGVALAIEGAPGGEPGEAPRVLLVGGVVVALVAVGGLQAVLTTDGGRSPRVVTTLCLLTAAALAASTLLGLGVLAQFAVLVAGLAVPVVYGTRRVFGPVA